MLGRLQHIGDISWKWGDLKSQGHDGYSVTDRKAFYTANLVFYSSCMNDGEFINYY